jgi:hypothetical protein
MAEVPLDPMMAAIVCRGRPQRLRVS